jgi:E1A/CREB-binding protein
VKRLGFTHTHIWACPPSPGDDYIFHSHPADQKTPTPKRLTEWYRNMLDRAKESGVIYDWQDLYAYLFTEDVERVCDLPYFEGDYWPQRIEGILQEMEQEEPGGAGSAALPTGKPEKGKKGRKGRKKNEKASKKGGKGRQTKKKGSLDVEEDLADRAWPEVEKNKDVFFVVQLHENPVR